MIKKKRPAGSPHSPGAGPKGKDPNGHYTGYRNHYPHVERHRPTLLLGRGTHPKVVQDLLGDAQIALTLDTYSHVLPDMQAGAVDAMNDVLEEDDEKLDGK